MTPQPARTQVCFRLIHLQTTSQPQRPPTTRTSFPPGGLARPDPSPLIANALRTTIISVSNRLDDRRAAGPDPAHAERATLGGQVARRGRLTPGHGRCCRAARPGPPVYVQLGESVGRSGRLAAVNGMRPTKSRALGAALIARAQWRFGAWARLLSGASAHRQRQAAPSKTRLGESLVRGMSKGMTPLIPSTRIARPSRVFDRPRFQASPILPANRGFCRADAARTRPGPGDKQTVAQRFRRTAPTRTDLRQKKPRNAP
jgi:hypothetical protein